MSALELLYTQSLRALTPALPLLSRGQGKLARGLRGRAGVLERMAAWAREGRDPERPLAWFHAPSVGEGLQARAVMEAFRARRPDAQVVYTYFSPSAEVLGRSIPADFADYLPLDLPWQVGRALDLLRPDVLAFSKTDVWPNLTREARRRNVRLALISGTLPETSSRLGGAARALLGPSYRRLDRVAAISPADAQRFARLGVPEDRRQVMGDARFDQVWSRAAAADRGSDLLRPLVGVGRTVIVAGSTWPEDEDRLMAAMAGVSALEHPWRLVLAPHEPTREHLERLERLLDGSNLSYRRLSRVDGSRPREDVVLVDRTGILGDLYAVAHIAYVGGGWGRAGLHSVLEPAAYGVPVLFGPYHANAREAAELMEAGAAFAAGSGGELTAQLRRLVTDYRARKRSGAAARHFVERNLGAAERGAEVVEALLPR